jgi:integrase/recombinase XerD
LGEMRVNGVGEARAQFHAYLVTEKRVATNTFLAYQQDIDGLNDFLVQEKIPFEKITKRHLTTYIKKLKEQGLSARSLSRKISTFKLFFRFVATTFAYPNAAQGLVFPKLEKTLPRYLTEQEIEKLLAAANRDSSNKGIRNKVMLYVLYATGMRVSELVNITVEQILFDEGFIRIHGKGGKERMVPLPKNIIELLRYYLTTVYPKMVRTHSEETQQVHYMFATFHRGHLKPLSRQSLWIALKKVVRQAAIVKNISPHSLRHSLATHLLRKGADLRSLQLLLGHQNLSAVQIYTHLGDATLRKIYDAKHPRA